jgi:hypothetical protein
MLAGIGEVPGTEALRLLAQMLANQSDLLRVCGVVGRDRLDAAGRLVGEDVLRAIEVEGMTALPRFFTSACLAARSLGAALSSRASPDASA